MSHENPTPLTQAGRLISKGFSKVISSESAHCFQVSEYRTLVPNLPESFEGFRIVQLSDLHFYEFGDPTFYQQVVDAANSLKPDAVVVTGDVIHYGPHYLGQGEFFLRQLTAPWGKWACMGNHDYKDDHHGEGLKAMMFDAGFTVLVNKAVCLEKDGAHLWLSGVDDARKGLPDFDMAFRRVPPEAAHVALVHNPQLAPLIEHGVRYAPHIILAGHTHGGHIRHGLLNWLQPVVFRQPYQYGWFSFERSRLYVTSGVGSAVMTIHTPHFDFALPPFRINTTPEIAVFDLTSH